MSWIEDTVRGVVDWVQDEALTVALGAGLMFFSPVLGGALLASSFIGWKKTQDLKDQPVPQREPTQRLEMVRSSVAPRRIVFGESLVSGPLIYAQVTGSSSEYMHMVIAVAEGEIDSVRAVYFNDDKLPAGDVNGNITTGTYANHARVRTYTGTAAQTADTLLVTESGGKWTSDHRLRGVAYVYARLQRNDDVYKSGLPQIRALVRGVKCYDPRDGQTRWTSNPALILRHYLTASYGLGCSNGEIDDAAVAAAANACDERVVMASHSIVFSLSASTDLLTFTTEDRRIATGDGVRITTTGSLTGTGLAINTTYYAVRVDETTCKLATTYANALAGVTIDITGAGTGQHTLQHHDQARYTCNGTVTLDMQPREIVQQILQTMMGSLVWSGGQYIMHAGVWTSPTVTIDEDDLRGPVTVRPRPPRQELFNGVRGTYVEPFSGWQITDFPAVRNGTYETEDGGAQILTDLAMPMVTDVTRAQRLAKMVLAAARSAETVVLPCKLHVLALQPWDTVSVNLAQLGYSGKTFRVVGWRMTQEDGALGVDLTLQAETSGVYGWSATDASYVPPPPRLDVPPQPYEGGAIPVAAVLPGGASEGDVVYLTTDDKLYRYNGSAWVTWVDGSDILAASITAGKLATKTITAASAVIDDAAINTLQIAGQAVTIPVSASSIVPTAKGSGWVSADVPCSIDSSGAPIHVSAMCNFQGSSWVAGMGDMRIRVMRNGTQIVEVTTNGRVVQFYTNQSYSITWYSVCSGSCVATIVDTPGSGMHTYTLEAYSNAPTTMLNRSLTLIETKR